MISCLSIISTCHVVSPLPLLTNKALHGILTRFSAPAFSNVRQEESTQEWWEDQGNFNQVWMTAAQPTSLSLTIGAPSSTIWERPYHKGFRLLTTTFVASNRAMSRISAVGYAVTDRFVVNGRIDLRAKLGRLFHWSGWSCKELKRRQEIMPWR